MIKRLLTIVALTVMISLCAGVSYLTFVWGLSPFFSVPEQRNVNLFSDGDRLYVSYVSPKEQFDIVTGKGSGVSIELNILPEHDSDNILTITDGAKKIVKQDPYLGSPLWSAKHGAAFFIRAYGESTSGDKIVEPPKTEIWMWTRSEGSHLFHRIYERRDQAYVKGDMSESLDGNWLVFEGENDGLRTRSIFLISVKNKQEIGFSTDIKDDGLLFMVDENTFFKTGNYKEKLRTKVFDKQSGKSQESQIEGELEQFVGFKGQVWALRCKAGLYDVVRVNHNLTQIEESKQIPLPKVLDSPI